jgi:hypothetical protein
MTWIDKILPVITLIIGFGLAEFGKYSADRKNDRKKLKRLLFNLLELRWLLRQEIVLNSTISKYIERFNIKINDEFGSNSVESTNYIKPVITKILKDLIVQPEKINEIEQNIDATIIELSELYPIFAYKLSGRYKIKEKLENAEKYFQAVSNQFEEFPTEIKNWIQPKISNTLISDLDDYIIVIAKKIDRKTIKNVSEILSPVNENDTSDIDEIMKEYINEMKKRPS